MPSLRSEDDDPCIHETMRARTRLTSPSVTVVCAARGQDGLFLADGTPFLPEQPPARETIRAARLSSVSVHRREWFKHFIRQPVPSSWAKVGALQSCRLAVFEGGRYRPENVAGSMELNRELGLVYRRGPADEES